jgi:hypothetical protein
MIKNIPGKALNKGLLTGGPEKIPRTCGKAGPGPVKNPRIYRARFTKSADIIEP